jgi:hypothetical protein
MMRPIDCPTFQFWCEDVSDRRLDAGFREALDAHRAKCAACGDFAFRSQHQRRAVRALPSRNVPVQLAVQLRIMASKDRAARAVRRDWNSRVEAWRRDMIVWVNNLLKPAAIPAAGGLASAVLLFGMLMPTFVVHANSNADTPAGWFQSAEVDYLSPFGVNAEQITVDVRIDSYGRVIDYTVPHGISDVWLQDKALRRAVENNLLFMSFRPAIFFGQPATDTIRITIRRSQIEVRG